MLQGVDESAERPLEFLQKKFLEGHEIPSQNDYAISQIFSTTVEKSFDVRFQNHVYHITNECVREHLLQNGMHNASTMSNETLNSMVEHLHGAVSQKKELDEVMSGFVAAQHEAEALSEYLVKAREKLDQLKDLLPDEMLEEGARAYERYIQQVKEVIDAIQQNLHMPLLQIIESENFVSEKKNLLRHVRSVLSSVKSEEADFFHAQVRAEFQNVCQKLSRPGTPPVRVPPFEDRQGWFELLRHMRQKGISCPEIVHHCSWLQGLLKCAVDEEAFCEDVGDIKHQLEHTLNQAVLDVVAIQDKTEDVFVREALVELKREGQLQHIVDDALKNYTDLVENKIIQTIHSLFRFPPAQHKGPVESLLDLTQMAAIRTSIEKMAVQMLKKIKQFPREQWAGQAAREMMQRVESLALHKKEEQVQILSELGLKLPKTSQERPWSLNACHDRHQLLRDFAVRNRYGLIPIERLTGKPQELVALAREYNKIATADRDRWLGQEQFAQLKKIERVTKRGLIQILPYREGQPVGQGTSKHVFSILVAKPTSQEDRVGAVISRFKEKVIAFPRSDKPERAPSVRVNLQKESTYSKVFREHKVRNVIDLRLVRHLDVSGAPIDVGAMMERCEGGSLLTYLRDNPTLPFQERIRLSLELAQALEDIHELNYCHNDLKPENVLITLDKAKRPHIRLIDFGNSSEKGNLDGFTGSFVSPEQYQSSTRGELLVATPANDMYGFANILSLLLDNSTPLHTSRLSHASLLSDKAINKNPQEGCPFNPAIWDRYAQLEARTHERAVSSGSLIDRCIADLLKTDPTHRPTARDVAGFLAPLLNS